MSEVQCHCPIALHLQKDPDNIFYILMSGHLAVPFRNFDVFKTAVFSTDINLISLLCVCDVYKKFIKY